MEARPGAQQSPKISALDIADSPFCGSSLPPDLTLVSNQNGAIQMASNSMTDLTERLRKGALVRASQKFTYELDGVPIEAATGEVRELCHPDALEAATTLETLTQENARLREALEEIAVSEAELNSGEFARGWNHARFRMCQIARKALGGGDEG